MPNANLCELNIRIPFDSEANADSICKVLRVDLDQHERFVKQELSVADGTLTAHFTATRPKDLRSGSSSFFESFLLCNEIINEFAPSDKSTD